MMKRCFGLSFLVLVMACTSQKHFGTVKNKYEVLADTETKVLRGYISRSTIENDTTFKWFAKNMKYGFADAGAVSAFKNADKDISLLVFGGTWCHDTQNLLPVFYRLIDKSGFAESKIQLVAVDRNKVAPDQLNNTFHLTNVPTFIVLKNGNEVGRVVEYGKDGEIDKELGQIVSANSSAK